MSTSIDQAFIKQYESEVHQAYQRMGSKLRRTVRNKSGIVGMSTTFQKVGKGTAGQKARHGLVPVMNVDHTPVECILEDWYAGEWIDRLDELKVNIDERQVAVNAGAYALGRKTDELITDVMEGASQIVGSGTNEGMTKAKVLEAFETLNTNDVPDDGNRWAIVSPNAWNGLLNITEFASSDFVGTDQLPWAGTQAKRWLGFTWCMFSGLPVDGNDIRSCYLYHSTAVGHASGAEVATDVTWHGDHAAHFVVNSMSQNAVLIDDLGIVELLVDETPD